MIHTLVITIPISSPKLLQIQEAFKTVHYYPQNEGIPENVNREAELWYTGWKGLPGSVKSLEDVPNTKAIQLSSAGANDCLAHPAFQTDEAKEKIKICSASGIHMLSIPQYVLSNVLALYMKLPLQFNLMRTNKEWLTSPQFTQAAQDAGYGYTGYRGLYGKTVGLLGYGHIAREVARLFRAFQCTVVAATSTGERKAAEGYEVEGLGDADGSIPTEMYSTNDPESLKKFVGACDVLIAVLPSTPQTRFMFTSELFSCMRKEAIFVNVGRGDLAKSEDILSALERKDGLLGAVLDVTDPEPLPAGHALYSHSRVILTPHTSGSVENYFDCGADVLLAQAKSLKAGKGLLNVVNPAKGY